MFEVLAKHRPTKNPKAPINCHCDPGFGIRVEPKDCPDIRGRLGRGLRDCSHGYAICTAVLFDQLPGTIKKLVHSSMTSRQAASLLHKKEELLVKDLKVKIASYSFSIHGAAERKWNWGLHAPITIPVPNPSPSPQPFPFLFPERAMPTRMLHVARCMLRRVLLYLHTRTQTDGGYCFWG